MLKTRRPVCRVRLIRFVLALCTLPQLASISKAADIPNDFPRFIVPGHEAEMDSLRGLFWVHWQSAGPQIALWDEWLPNATLWPAIGSGDDLNAMRRRWAKAFASRPMDSDGYIHTQQHDGPAHAHGWPFPMWTQAGGIGWHFRPIGVPGYEVPLATTAGWKLEHAADQGINDRGWLADLKEPYASAQSPPFAVEAIRAPWLRLNWWATGLTNARCFVEWTTEDDPEFGRDRRITFDPPSSNEINSGPETRTMICTYKHPAWKGVITGLRIGYANQGDAQIVIKSFHTACDTRMTVNNLNYIRGCRDYFLWSLDQEFLRSQVARIRMAMKFIERECQTRERKCMYTTWPGHEGRSGIRYVNGEKQIRLGEGIGSNYWDLLPFGGEDALATVYYYDTLIALADLEELMHSHPAWKVAADGAYDPADLRKHAAEVKAYFGQRFWNPKTGRFGTADLDGELHDYGFTFLNNEAVAFGIATPEQAQSILAWTTGKRIVEGDTSTGPDIYHFRFGPRATTRRNIDYYFWAWSNPESIPFGAQVQDGGAVLAWSYYDLAARLKAAGPDAAAARLRPLTEWFSETQAAGGYRAYYAQDPSRGSLQGGNVAGGLGLDKEFIENVMVPQVMLYDFLGFQPTVDGFSISPRLPKDWPELTVTRVHLHDAVVSITATEDGFIQILADPPSDDEIVIAAPHGVRLLAAKGVRARIVARQSTPLAP